MASKSYLTIALAVSVTFLGACGDNKSKKANFRPKGGAIRTQAAKPNQCDGVSPGGLGTKEQKCAAWTENIRLNTKPDCRGPLLNQMRTTGCEISPDLLAAAPTNEVPVAVNQATPPSVTQTVTGGTDDTAQNGEVDQDRLATQADTRVVTDTEDPATGDRSATVDPGAVAGVIPAENLAPVPAPASTTVAGATAGTSDAPAADPVTAALCPADVVASSRTDTTSQPNLKRINNKAKAFAESLSLEDVERYTDLSVWANDVCRESLKTVSAAAAIKTEIKAVIPAANSWTSANYRDECKTALTDLAMKASRSIRCGGQPDTVWPARLTSESPVPSDDASDDEAPSAAPSAAAPSAAAPAAPAASATN